MLRPGLGYGFQLHVYRIAAQTTEMIADHHHLGGRQSQPHGFAESKQGGFVEIAQQHIAAGKHIIRSQTNMLEVREASRHLFHSFVGQNPAE